MIGRNKEMQIQCEIKEWNEKVKTKLSEKKLKLLMRRDKTKSSSDT
jgi:hypothetical protein